MLRRAFRCPARGHRDAFGSAVTNRLRSAVSNAAGDNLALAGALFFALVVCDSLAHAEFAGRFGPVTRMA